MYTFGEELKYLRQNRHYTQQELANNTIARDTVARIELHNQNTAFQTGIQLLENLGLSLTDYENQLIAHKSNNFSELVNLFMFEYTSPSDVDVLNKIHNLACLIYSEKENTMVKNLYTVSEVMLLMNEVDTGAVKMNDLKNKIEPVWEDLSNMGRFIKS